MQAIHMTACGGPEVLVPVTLPQPEITSPTQILVRVKAAGVNPVDTKLRRNGLFYPAALPAILGLDGTGVVEDMGTQVEHLRRGDEVWYCHGGLGAAPGNYAEYHLIEQAEVQLKPKACNFMQAAAGPLVLLTAWEALFDRGHLEPGHTVLIHAGAGGVGHVAIQMAKLAGARVITTVSGPKKAEFVRDLGADAVIDYRQQDWVQEVLSLTDGHGVNLAVDTVGPAVFAATIPVVAHYGALITLLDPGAVDLKEARTRNLRIGFELMLTPMLRDLPTARAHQGEILYRCSEWLDAGHLRIHVSATFPLAQAAQAHLLLEQGHVQGKVVLIP